MRFYHATPTQNLASIYKNGLDPNYAILHKSTKSVSKYVWLHTKSNTPWAILHTMKKHNVSLSEVSVIAVDVPSGWIRRHRLVSKGVTIRGIWKTNRVIPASRFAETTAAEQFAAGVSDD